MSVNDYRPETFITSVDQSQWLVRLAEQTDQPQLTKLLGLARPSGVILLSFLREPDYFETAQVTCVHTETWVVLSSQNEHELVAMYTLGVRPCYINGHVEMLRYLNGFRISPQVKVASALQVLVQHLYRRLPPEQYCQAIHLADDRALRRLLLDLQPLQPRLTYYVDQVVHTSLMTGYRALETHPLHVTPSTELCSHRVATAADVPMMNQFVQVMARYFNFLPRYDFNGVLEQQAYWYGLSIADFTLVFQNRRLVGLFAIWDQRAFKQTQVVRYHPLIALIRPLYNLWAARHHRLLLPPAGQDLPHLILHSALCQPDDVRVFDYILQVAFEQVKQRGAAALCYSLCEQDPRRVVQDRQYGNSIQGVHGFCSFGDSPTARFDSSRLTFVECARI